MLASHADQACRECRRRKGKCDSKLPTCSACQRYGRHCLYDKYSRSALTRKHLTEVEERLERAEALLKTAFTESELAKLLAHKISSNRQSHSTSSKASRDDNSYNVLKKSKYLHSDSPYPHADDDRGPNLSSQPAAYSRDPLPTTIPKDEPNLGDILPSAADEDFEWDERDTRQNAPYDVDESVLRKISDGMATLTTNASNTGFLGAVSGAALLRRTLDSDDMPSNTSELEDQRRDSLTDFLAFQMLESSPSSGSWLQNRPIMTRALADNLIDLYFAYYHPIFPILHEATFREQYRHLNERPRGVLHILANLVAALGSFATTDSSDETDLYLFNAVKSQLTIESLETGSLNLVQAFAMAATYLQKRNRPNSGYNYGGVALRLAISLGLHKEFRTWNVSPLKKEIRRRVWWSLCVLDVGATVTYGRPLSWPQAGVEAHLPRNIREQDLQITSISLPSDLDEATPYTYVKTQSAYHIATIPIYHRLIGGSLPSAVEMMKVDDDIIESWRSHLPSFFNDTDLLLSREQSLGHAISRWRFRIMRILMYRPFFLKWVQKGLQPLQSSSSEDNATSRCLAAAEECITITSRFWASATHTRLVAWYVLYFLMQAVLIPVHCMRHVTSHPQLTNWTDQVRLSLEIVSTMTHVNSSALRCRDVIYKLCGSHLMEQKTVEGQQMSFQEVPSDISSIVTGEVSTNSWIAELDTVVNHYDMSCDRLSKFPDASRNADANTYGSETGQASSEAYAFTSLGLGTEDYDWDLGLMLMQ